MAYQQLQPLNGVFNDLSVKELVRFSQWTRFDPRLGELWLSALDRQWRNLAPLPMRQENLAQANPAVMGVLLDQYQSVLCPRRERRLFRLWSATVLDGVARAQNESFFIGVQGFASQRAREDAERPFRSFKKWGFFGRDVFQNKFLLKQKTNQKTGIALAERRQILVDLIKEKERIAVQDYIEACGGFISRRVAQKDLRSEKKLKCIGNTRAQFYVRKSTWSRERDSS